MSQKMSQKVEDVGGGIMDMVNICKDWGIPEPEFEDAGTSIVVTFRKSFITDRLMSELNLNERQKKAINYLKEHKKITNKEYRGNPLLTVRFKCFVKGQSYPKL